MARIPYPDPTAAPAPVREALEAVPPLNIFRMLSHAETAFRPFLRFGGAVLGALELDARLRELAILEVARLTPARYEWVQHVPIAEAVGVSAEQVAALEAGDLDAACLGEQDRLVLAFTGQVVRGIRPDDEIFDRLTAALSPREIVELLLTIGEYMMLARVMVALDLEIDEPAGSGALRVAERAPELDEA
jgi:4-carboxymuconolactone decarboxylase